MLRIIAIDDEPISLSIIKEFCRRIGNIELKCFCDAKEGMEAVKKEQSDLLLLDSQLGDDNGIQIARQRPSGTALIFTTAHTEYALEGFNLDAVDYLHKPFAFDRFKKAIEKVARRQRGETLQKNPQAVITLKSGYKNVVINLDDICFAEAQNNYVCLFLTDKRQVRSQTTLTILLEQLPETQFVRIHRSFVVSRSYVTRFNRRQVFIKDYDNPIPIGRTYADYAEQQLTPGN